MIAYMGKGPPGAAPAFARARGSARSLLPPPRRGRERGEGGGAGRQRRSRAELPNRISPPPNMGNPRELEERGRTQRLTGEKAVGSVDVGGEAFTVFPRRRCRRGGGHAAPSPPTPPAVRSRGRLACHAPRLIFAAGRSEPSAAIQ